MTTTQNQSDLFADDEEDDLQDVFDDNYATSDGHKISDTGTNFRKKARIVIHSQKFNIAVITLVVLDISLVLIELLIDVNAVQKHQPDWQHLLEFVLKCCSISILSIFLLENLLKIYVMRCEFFHHYLEVLDALVVVTSLIFDIVFINEHNATIGLGLIIIFRLWRILRVINGIVLTVKSQSDSLLEKEKQRRLHLLEKFKQMRHVCHTQQEEIKNLRRILQDNNIEIPSMF